MVRVWAASPSDELRAGRGHFIAPVYGSARSGAGFSSPATWLFSVCVAVGGAMWAWLYERTGSLLGPWLSHLLVDAAIFAIGYDLVRHTFN